MVSIKARANSYGVGGDFGHLVDYSVACTLEREEVCAKEYGRISFTSLDEVINVDDLECFGQGMAQGKQQESN